EGRPGVACVPELVVDVHREPLELDAVAEAASIGEMVELRDDRTLQGRDAELDPVFRFGGVRDDKVAAVGGARYGRRRVSVTGVPDAELVRPAVGVEASHSGGSVLPRRVGVDVAG